MSRRTLSLVTALFTALTFSVLAIACREGAYEAGPPAGAPGNTPGAPAGSAPVPTGPPAPGDPAGPPSGPPRVGYNRLPPVPIGTPADFGGNVLVRVTQVTPVQLEGQGPGTTAGPGVDVTVEVRNLSGSPFDLLGVAVTATYDDGTPAVPVPMASGPPLRGSVAPGSTATGQYAFRLPADMVPTLVFEVTSSRAPNVIAVRGR
jgi:hypothetical protein